MNWVKFKKQLQNNKKIDNCLNCRYEPDWVYVDGFYQAHHRFCGRCKWEWPASFLEIWKRSPIIYSLTNKQLEIYLDGQGLIDGCKAWKSV